MTRLMTGSARFSAREGSGVFSTEQVERYDLDEATQRFQRP